MRTVLYLIVLLLLTSCSVDKIEKPKNLIKKSEMIDLLIDMKIAQKAKNIQNKHKKKNVNYMSYVYEKYNIDSTQFKESNNYYTEKLDLYHEIYSKVEERLADSIAKYEKIIKIKDSLTKEEKKKKRKPKIKLDELKKTNIKKTEKNQIKIQ